MSGFSSLPGGSFEQFVAGAGSSRAGGPSLFVPTGGAPGGARAALLHDATGSTVAGVPSGRPGQGERALHFPLSAQGGLYDGSREGGYGLRHHALGRLEQRGGTFVLASRGGTQEGSS